MNKPWSKLRQMLETEFLCDSLKGRVRYFNTLYRRAHDNTGRICILVDDIEKINMPFETEYKISAEVYKRNDKTKSLKNRYEEVTEEFKENGIFEPYDFGCALNEFFTNSIEESFKSEDYIVRILAIFDRRAGKRTLEKLKSTVKDLPEWLQYFYNLRLESEGLL